VAVTVTEQHGVVAFAVSDDGPGFAPDEARRGQGILNICDRIGAVGGTVEWTSAPGAGTRVQGSVPLSEWAVVA
jgi:signal transduction histidine kinase